MSQKLTLAEMQANLPHSSQEKNLMALWGTMWTHEFFSVLGGFTSLGVPNPVKIMFPDYKYHY